MPKVSVIIPVYNVEEYLAQCLDSIINQTYKDIEIICINDGSTDNSALILEKYKEKDSRIKICHQQNTGQGTARNRALKIATGDYILFCDPDDWLELDTIDTCYNFAIEHNANVIQFNYRCCGCDGNNTISEYNLAHFIKEKYNYDLNRIGYFKYKDIDDFYKIDMHIFTRFYARNFLLENNIRFSDGRYGEDWLFSISTLLKVDKIFYLDKCYYNYRIRENSSSSSTSKDVMHIFTVFKEIQDFLITNNMLEDLKQPFILYKIQMISWAYNLVPCNLRLIFDINCLTCLPIYNFMTIKLTMYRKNINKFLKRCFSVYKENNHKIICLLGFKCKFKNYG